MVAYEGFFATGGLTAVVTEKIGLQVLSIMLRNPLW